ncbi:class I SAM-dependent methyltransferase [Psychrobacillus sp. NPDC096623]|uniref:class I SAM-dependent methyltransferase n=1 Tax=Psychrobacillus sp. NPDC096623 TaxID=3364492 RepID=UPI00382DE89F
MKLKRVLPYAKQLLTETVESGDIVVDATAGNGHDTLFLTELVGAHGHVYAFDVQAEAILATTKRLKEANKLEIATLINDGHENLNLYIKQEVSAAIFNLGYLPGSNHEIVTRGESTQRAIESLLQLLKVGGIIVLVVYHGHAGGKEEKDSILRFVQGLSQSFVHVLSYQFLNQQNDPPFIIAIEKMKQLQ